MNHRVRFSLVLAPVLATAGIGLVMAQNQCKSVDCGLSNASHRICSSVVTNSTLANASIKGLASTDATCTADQGSAPDVTFVAIAPLSTDPSSRFCQFAALNELVCRIDANSTPEGLPVSLEGYGID